MPPKYFMPWDCHRLGKQECWELVSSASWGKCWRYFNDRSAKLHSLSPSEAPGDRTSWEQRETTAARHTVLLSGGACVLAEPTDASLSNHVANASAALRRRRGRSDGAAQRLPRVLRVLGPEWPPAARQPQPAQQRGYTAPDLRPPRPRPGLSQRLQLKPPRRRADPLLPGALWGLLQPPTATANRWVRSSGVLGASRTQRVCFDAEVLPRNSFRGNGRWVRDILTTHLNEFLKLEKGGGKIIDAVKQTEFPKKVDLCLLLVSFQLSYLSVTMSCVLTELGILFSIVNVIAMT